MTKHKQARNMWNSSCFIIAWLLSDTVLISFALDFRDRKITTNVMIY